MQLSDISLSLRSSVDIVTVRQRAGELAVRLGLSSVNKVELLTAISEVARNALEYGKGGDVTLSAVQQGARRGITVVVVDHGPGIPDVELALTDGYSTGGSLGLGLPGAQRLVDEFTIASDPGGTRVTMIKWSRD